MLIVVVQVDDYLYAGTMTLTKEFEVFFINQFGIGSFEAERIHVMRATLYQDKFGVETLDANENLSAIKAVFIPSK